MDGWVGRWTDTWMSGLVGEPVMDEKTDRRIGWWVTDGQVCR